MRLIARIMSSNLYRKAFWYVIIGLCAFIVDYSLFIWLEQYAGIDKFFANLISMHVGAIFSFALNSYMNFKQTDRLFKKFISYYFITLVGIGISSIIIAMWPEQSLKIGKVVAMIVVSLMQFLLNYFVTFDGKKGGN